MAIISLTQVRKMFYKKENHYYYYFNPTFRTNYYKLSLFKVAPFNWAKFHILIHKFNFENHLHYDKGKFYFYHMEIPGF